MAPRAAAVPISLTVSYRLPALTAMVSVETGLPLSSVTTVIPDGRVETYDSVRPQHE